MTRSALPRIGAAGADLGIGVLVDQAGRPRLLTRRGHLGPAGPGRGGAVRHRARTAGGDPALRAVVGAYRGGGAVRQRGAVPAVRGGRADRGLLHGRDHQRDHAAVDRGAGPGRAAPEERDELAGGRADRRVRRGGADLHALAHGGRAVLGRWPGMPGRLGQLRGQLHLHGPVPGPPGNRPGRAVRLPARRRRRHARDHPGRHRRSRRRMSPPRTSRRSRCWGSSGPGSRTC